MKLHAYFLLYVCMYVCGWFICCYVHTCYICVVGLYVVICVFIIVVICGVIRVCFVSVQTRSVRLWLRGC